MRHVPEAMFVPNISKASHNPVIFVMFCLILPNIVCWKAAEQQIPVVKPLAVPSSNLQLQPFPETQNSASKIVLSLVYGLFLDGFHYEP